MYQTVWKKLIDIGDIVGIKGYVFTTKTGETSIHVREFSILTKSLRPLPIVKEKDGEAFDEVTDPEFRYRQRYADLIVNPSVKETFIKRTKMVNSIREFLNERGALEVDTPVLQSIPGGAAATTTLAALGADGMKVESGAYPDPFRGWQAAPSDGQAPPEDPWNHAPTFEMVNRNKRDVCLDLKSERGRELLLDIVRTSDVVTENFRTGVMARLGLSYDVLREVNPRIVMLSLGSQG